MKWMAVFGLVAWLAPCAFADDVTLTTFYPSPRGVYKELRAENLKPLDNSKPFSWDLNAGTVTASSVQLIDAETGKTYSLGISNGRLAITDLEAEKSFVFMEVPDDTGARSKHNDRGLKR